MKKYFRIRLVLPLLLALTFSNAQAQDLLFIDDLEDPDGAITSVTLVWDRNSEPNVAGYNVYYGRTSGNYVPLAAVTEPTATISVRGKRSIYFAVTAFTADGLESPFSAEVRWQ